MSSDQDKARIDRELIELLNEIRIVLPGVQVLFAFLLILPFQQRFDQTSEVDRAIYGLALLSIAAAAALLIAPSAYHRLNFRRRNKERMLFDSNRLLIGGIIATGVGITCSIYLVADVVYGPGVALPATVATSVLFGALWLALPLLRRNEPDV